MNKNKTEMKNAVPEMNNTLEGTKIRLDKEEGRIRDLEDNVEKTTSHSNKMKKILKNNQNSLRELWDNMKCNNISVISISQGEEREQGIESMFEEIMTNNFPKVEKKQVMQVQEEQSPNQAKPIEAQTKAYHH